MPAKFLPAKSGRPPTGWGLLGEGRVGVGLRVGPVGLGLDLLRLAAAGELLATLGLVPEEEAVRLQHTAGRVAAMLTGLIRRLR